MDRISTSVRTKFRVCDSFKDKEGNSIPIIYGPLSFEEAISKKGYRYRDGFWQHQLNKDVVKEAIESRRMLGMIEHPESDSEYLSTPYDKASHLILDVELKKGNPYGKVALVNNPHGNSIKALVDLEVPIGISTRGLGSIERDSVSEYIDEDNYALLTWDFTRNPNLEDACMAKLTDSIMETPLFKGMVQAYQLRDSVDESYNPKKLKEEMESMCEEMQVRINKFKDIISKI